MIRAGQCGGAPRGRAIDCWHPTSSVRPSNEDGFMPWTLHSHSPELQTSHMRVCMQLDYHP